jgi:hypothetical protein
MPIAIFSSIRARAQQLGGCRAWASGGVGARARGHVSDRVEPGQHSTVGDVFVELSDEAVVDNRLLAAVTGPPSRTDAVTRGCRVATQPPWIRFCIAAHLEQARQRLDQIAAASTRWATLEALVESRGWPDRLVIALEQSLFDGAERKAYAAEADVSLATATTDLRRLLDAGLIDQQGRTRSTRYVASQDLRKHVQSQL